MLYLQNQIFSFFKLKQYSIKKIEKQRKVKYLCSKRTISRYENISFVDVKESNWKDIILFRNLYVKEFYDSKKKRKFKIQIYFLRFLSSYCIRGLSPTCKIQRRRNKRSVIPSRRIYLIQCLNSGVKIAVVKKLTWYLYINAALSMEFYINWWSQTNFSMCYRAWHVSISFTMCMSWWHIFFGFLLFARIFRGGNNFQAKYFYFSNVLFYPRKYLNMIARIESFMYIDYEYIKNFWLKIILITDFNNWETYFYRKRKFCYIFIFHLSIIYSIWWIFHNFVYRLF